MERMGLMVGSVVKLLRRLVGGKLDGGCSNSS